LLGIRLGTVRLERRFPPPGQMIDAGGHRLHLYCRGEGAPVVLLESGLGATWVDWRLVVPEVARFTQVCVYDRAGYGWSDAGPAPRTGQRLAEELHRAATGAGLSGSRVLVGHSFGALVARLYAARFPAQAAGLVLVDPQNEDSGREPARPRRSLVPPLGWQRLGRLWKGKDGLPPPLQQADAAFQSRWVYWSPLRQLDAEAAELESTRTTEAEVRAAGVPAGLPLIVLTAAGSDSRPLGNRKHIVAARSGHYIQLDEPPLVIEAIREIVEAARRR